jgi:DNA-binding NarL/FixJ family response regulator
MSNIRVLLADDHAMVREGLRALINSQPGFEVVGEAGDGNTAVAMTMETDPDIVVVDVSMPELSGAQVAAKLRQLRPDRKIIALTVHEERAFMRMLLEAGVSGYVLKRSAADKLVSAIRAVGAGGSYIDPSLRAAAEELSVPPPPTTAENNNTALELSERETEVVKLIALGYSNKEIAARLALSVKTIETYKTRSMEKLGIRSRVEIVQYAAKRGWLENV